MRSAAARCYSSGDPVAIRWCWPASGPQLLTEERDNEQESREAGLKGVS